MNHLNDLYQELIIDHGTAPRNFTVIVNPSTQEEGFNPLCGDKIIVFLEIKDNNIVNATFQGQGCAISTASASIMTEVLIGKTTQQATQLANNFIASLTNDQLHNNNSDHDLHLPYKLLALISVKNYPSRVKCATLAWHTLTAALEKTI